MRKFIFTAVALLVAAPALAQPAYEDDRDPPRDEIAIDAADVARMGRAMERMVGALMDLPVGGIAAAIDPLGRGGVHPDDTVRDLAERDDPYAEQRIRAGIRGTASGIGAMSEALARMMPVLRRSIDDIRRSVDAAMDEADDREPY